jgi:flagellin-like hook-associated protein FlgL
MAKHGKLKDMKIKEVSLVDLPANKSPFLFFKRDGDPVGPINKQKKKIKIEIESDSTVGGTSVAVNGKKLGKLKSFDFGFYGGDPKAMVHASYTKASDGGDGFTRTETYYLTKGESTMKDETLKALKKYLGTDEVDFEKAVNEDELVKALELISAEYKDSFPEDLEKAVALIAKCAVQPVPCPTCSEDDDVKKAGAKFSKDVLRKLKAVLDAVESLKGILPSDESKQKSTGGDDAIDELTKQLSDLKSTLGAAENKAEKATTSELAKTLKEVSDRLKALETNGVTRKSIEGDDGEEGGQRGAGENGKPLWPTLTGQK